MPIVKAAIKHLRKSEKRRAVNRNAKDRLKAAMKEMMKLAQAKKLDEFSKRMPEVMALVDKAAKNNLIHPNNADRKKSKLARVLAAK